MRLPALAQGSSSSWPRDEEPVLVREDAATAVFQQLQETYQRQDMAAVAALLAQVRRGVFETAGTALTTVAHLRAWRDALATRRGDLLTELATLQTNAAYGLAGAEEAARAAYLTEHRAALLVEQERLVARLAGLELAAN